MRSSKDLAKQTIISSHDYARFSLLLLEYGEIYFEDFSVNMYPPNLPEAEAIAR